MLDILYFILIYPLEQSLDFILGFLIKCLHSPALSIIAISILINLFLFKLFVYTDRLAESDKAIKQKLDSRIKGWKSVYKGAKLHAFTKTLYRQNHYHPIFALRGLGGLALQIPFFIAIAAVISKSSVFEGISFLWINDLSKPDSVLFANLHILPLLMTIFTLLNVFISSKERAARIQGTLIALIFLVLLYNMPSALVLYWTINTLFYLLKSVINNYKLSLRRNKSQETSKIFSVIHHHCDSSKESSSCHKPTTCHSEGVQSMTEESANTRFFAHTRNDKVDSIDCHASQVKLAMTKGVCCHKSINVDSSNDNTNKSLYINISIFAILNISFLICVFSPFAVYSSDVSQFDPTQTSATLSALFGIFLLSSFVCIYLTSFFYNTRLLKLGTFAVSVILLIGLVYTFILDYNVVTGEAYSQMDNFVFKNPHNLSNPYAKYVDLGIGIGACILALFLLRFAGFWDKALKIISATLALVWLFSLFTIYAENKKLLASKQEIKLNANLDELLPSFMHDLGAFSKDKQNVLVLLFDGFTGSHLKVILEQFPEFKNNLQGFTYYPNTLSLDGHTSRTAHTILTGHNLSAYAQKDKSMQQYSETITNALINSFSQFASKGFEVQSYGMPYISSNDLDTPYITIIEANQDFLPYYEKIHNIQEQIQNLRAQNRPIGEMASIGLFYFAPYSLRTRIYKDFEFGNYSWLFGARVQIGSFINGISAASALSTIVRNLNTDAKNKTFKYIHTNHTHYPFALDSTTCTPKMHAPSQLPQEYNPFIANKGHYDNEICAMKEAFILIDFLKKNKIYDNTMLVLISDHSYNDIIDHKQAYKPSIGNNPNPLLLIKDFNSNAPLKVDSRLMSNADVYGILCDKLKACNKVNILKNYPESRELIHTLNVHWTEQAKNASYLIFEKIWRVKDNVLDPNAFKEINKEQQ